MLFDNNEENNETIVDISTTEEGMRLSLNQYNNSTFKFYDKDMENSAMTVHGNKVDMHDHNITNVANPVNA